MKKLLLATLLIGIMGGCTEPTVKTKMTPYAIGKGHSNEAEYLEIIVIEGCEYFKCFSPHSVIITHKGNCSNPIHKGGQNEN
jgi:hypothetical protein